MKKTLALYKKLNTHQRIFNRVFRCHGLVLMIHSVVEIQIQASFAIKMKTVE